MNRLPTVVGVPERIIQAIVELLSAHGPLDKYQLVRVLAEYPLLRCDSSQINRVLYTLESAGVARRSSDTLPRWSLHAGVPTEVQEPKKSHAAAGPVRSVLPDLRPWQIEALGAWKAAEYCGVVQAVTGTGKTRVGIEAAREAVSLGLEVLILVPSRTLLNQWYLQLQRIFGEGNVGRRGDGQLDDFLDCQVLISTPQSATGELYFGGNGLLIADECHRYGAKSWRRALDPRFSRRLGLSATYERGDVGDEHLAEYFGGDPVFDIAYDRALSEGIVSPFILAFVGVSLGAEEMQRYREYDAACAKARGKLINEHFLPERPFADFMRAVSQAADNEMGGRAQRTAWTYLSNFAKRRDLLADSSAKLRRLDALDTAIKCARGTLVFTQTRAAAVSATSQFAERGHTAAAIWGELESNEREQILESFRRGDTSVVSAPRVLDEGVDVPEADLAIVVSASSGRRQMIQRMGRVLRLKADGRMARFVVLFAVDTSEDPVRGAHEGFISIAEDVAAASKRFGPEASAHTICQFLLGG